MVCITNLAVGSNDIVSGEMEGSSWWFVVDGLKLYGRIISQQLFLWGLLDLVGGMEGEYWEK